jgi:hypothetical protein
MQWLRGLGEKVNHAHLLFAGHNVLLFYIAVGRKTKAGIEIATICDEIQPTISFVKQIDLLLRITLVYQVYR